MNIIFFFWNFSKKLILHFYPISVSLILLDHRLQDAQILGKGVIDMFLCVCMYVFYLPVV